MACSSGRTAAGWGTAKLRFQALLAQASGGALGQQPLQLAAKEALSAALEGAIRDLKAVDAFSPQVADDCGMGKLCLQLLSMASLDDTTALAQLFSSLEQLSSPTLTMLLDVPWAVLAQTGWPFFGLLAQLHLRKAQIPVAMNNEALDGLDSAEGKTFQATLTSALSTGNGKLLEQASAVYLQKEAKGSALGSLTALGAQAALTQPQDRLAILQAMQQAFRQVIGNGEELDIALGTRWPLWGLLHASVDLLFA